MKKICLALMITTLLFVGCGEKKQEATNQGNNNTQEESSNASNDKETQTEDTSKEDENTSIEKLKGKVNLYAPNSDLTGWALTEKDVNLKDIKVIIEDLIKIDNTCIPKETKVNKVEVKDKIAYVDLSGEFNDSNSSSSAATNAKIYSIVNTLTINKNLNIDSVKFLLDGKDTEEIGQMITSDPLKANTNL